MTEPREIEEKQYRHGTIHDGQCNGLECGGLFICPQCNRLCGWCFGGAADSRCDACFVGSPEKKGEFRHCSSIDFALDEVSPETIDRLVLAMAKARLFEFASRFLEKA